jgi:hypothetical protein
MATRLQADVKCGALGQRARVFQRYNLTMRGPGSHVIATADDPAVLDYHAADHRVRARTTAGLCCQSQGFPHEMLVLVSRLLGVHD